MAKKKTLDISQLRIERVIIHDIPKHKKSETEIIPNYSESDTDISDGMRVFFKDKIISALQSVKAFNICFDEGKDSPVSVYVKDLLVQGNDVFINNSKKIADRLLKSQDGVNTAGILLIIDGSIEGKKVCIFMKLERDKGLQLKRNEQTNSFDLQEVGDLMMTEKTKMYKIVLFLSRTDFNTKYDGILIDFQIDIKAKKEIQTFFMTDFLGCKPFEDPKISTQRFYNCTKIFIEDMIEDKITQTEYIQDLNSYIQKNQNTISPKEFADDYFKESDHKDNYKKYMKEKGISYNKASMKDDSLVSEKIKKITVTFENDIAIIGNKGTLYEKVIFSQSEDGIDKAEIISKIKNVK